MRLRSPRGLALGGAVALSAVLATTATAATQPRVVASKRLSVSVEDAGRAFCASREVRRDSVERRILTAPATGVVSARLDGPARGNWDLAVLDANSGRVLNGSAGLGADEVADAYVADGQRLAVQVCRRSGAGEEAKVAVAFTAVPLPAKDAYALRQVRVALAGPADAERLERLGLDVADSPRAASWDVLLHSAADERRLKASGLRFTVTEPDVVARDLAARREEQAVAADPALRAQAAAATPGGRTSYRTLAEINQEMQALAARHPDLVRVFALPLPSVEGRQILGMEIAEGVNAPGDGRPAYVQVGTHHAREWPANEATLEFGLDLVAAATGTTYGGRPVDPRMLQIVRGARTYVVPVLNVDGFNVTIQAELAAAGGNLSDPVDSGGASGSQGLGQGAYKRKNCRVPADPALAALSCLARSFPVTPATRDHGVDLNRNYGVQWGGPGSSNTPTSLTYHGPGPFSEPETEAFRRFLRDLQPSVVITNHTYSGLILRPPGVNTSGPVPDEDRLRSLGDAMALQTGYRSQFSYQLYDTSGTTDDFVYDGLGGFSYTPEIGQAEFHPAYTDPNSGFVAEYDGRPETDVYGTPTGRTLGGLREAFVLAGLRALDPDTQGTLAGRAPAGRTLRIARTAAYQTSAAPDATGVAHPVQTLTDPRTSTLRVGAAGTFDWRVNPSRQPRVPAPGAWHVTCEDGAGNVLEARDVFVERGQTVQLGLRCGEGSTPTQPQPTQACPLPDGFERVAVGRRVRGLRVAFTRGAGSGPVTVEVLQTSAGRRIIRARRVARFAGRTASFTWNGRGPGGARVGNGVYVVRLTTTDARGRRDVRRIVVERRSGRFVARGTYHLADSCG